MTDAASDQMTPADPVELTIDELARRADLPVRTIREYQTMGLLPPPERRGRVGIYRGTHLSRLAIIERLQGRGYSLAGIRDLLTSWRDGSDLGDVLGLAPDQLVHLDEPGTPATLEHIELALPGLVPERLDEVLAMGVVEACAPGRFCIPSPSLLVLAAEALAGGYTPDQVLGVLGAIRQATNAIADATITLLAEAPPGATAEGMAALATRGRGLLAHATGRLTVHTIGRRLGIVEPADTTGALQQLLEDRR